MISKRIALALVIMASFFLGGCSIVHYSFSGTSIQPDVKTVTINYFEYKALKVNPSLSNDLTEAMKDKFRTNIRVAAPAAAITFGMS